MRIISGQYKGRRLTAPKNLPVRPTTDMAKEALFNILNNQYYFDEISVKSTKHALDDFPQLLDRFLWYKSSSQTLSDTLGPKKWGPATYQTRAMLPL